MFTEIWSPHVVLLPSSWTFPLRQGSSSSLLILPGVLRSDREGLSVSSPSGEREDACGLRRWCKFPALEFYSASFLHWISSLSYPYLTTLYILNKRLIKQLFPDFCRRRPRFGFPGSTPCASSQQKLWRQQRQGRWQGWDNNGKGVKPDLVFWAIGWKAAFFTETEWAWLTGFEGEKQ